MSVTQIQHPSDSRVSNWHLEAWDTIFPFGEFNDLNIPRFGPVLF